VSSLYETDPVGLKEQPPFYNCVVRIETTLSPEELLQACQAVERKLGRKRLVRWGPRTIDIDILTYGRLLQSAPHLVLPHPRMQQREFVMIPLREITEGKITASAGVRFIRSDWYPTCL
jgi:2-amino-4-hydroxy-6-hydroxymethyldihydropteridine diphosphokinase